MPWPIASENTRSNKAFYRSVALTVGLLFVCAPGAVSAVDSEIGVSVCGGSVPPAVIDITQPVSDSVVNQSATTFRGTIARATQVEISIDGQYNNTFAIGANDVTFQTEIMIPSGTHTVEMTANAICGGQNATDSIVVTYEPIVEPTSGGTTPTTLDGKTTLDGQPVDQPLLEEGDIMRQIEDLPLLGSAVSVVSDFAINIGLTSTISGENTPAVTGVARVGLTVAAITSVVMASSLAPVAAQSIRGVGEVFKVRNSRSMLYLGWIIRGAGVLTLALAYFL